MGFESVLGILSGIILLLITPWVLFSLVSTFCDATVGYLDEWLLGKISNENDKSAMDAPGQLIIISGLFGIVVSVIVLILAWAVPAIHIIFTSESFLNAFAAGILEVIWLIPYFYAIERGGALNTTPLFQTIPIFSLFIGIMFFGEIPIFVHILAALLIISGALILNYSPALRKIDKRTLLLMLLSSAIISVGYFLFKDAAELSNFATAAFGNGLGMGFLSFLIWVLWKPYREQFIKRLLTFDRKIIFAQTANEGLYAVAAVFNQLAIVFGPSVMMVSAMAAFHPVFTLLIGSALAKLHIGNYKESFSSNKKYTKIVAILIIAAGTILIAI